MMRSAAAAFIGVLALQLYQLAWGFAPPSHYHRRSPSTQTATHLNSIPTSLDTLTSGLASIARLPHGVTVSGGISTSGPASRFLPQILKLYDIENDRDCRLIREKITEYDLIVTEVIPSTSNSRQSAVKVVPTLIALVDGNEVSYSGADSILTFLNEKFSTEKQVVSGSDAPTSSTNEDDEESTPNEAAEVDVEETVLQIKDGLLKIASYLPGILRSGRGTNVCTAASSKLSPPRPSQPLVLYSYEGNQFCRLVREVLTELDIVYELRSAGKGSPRREELSAITGGSSQQPFIIDPNTGIQMADSKEIIEYLYSKYALWAPPSELLRSASNVVTPLLAPIYKVIAPLQAGSKGENDYEYQSVVEEAKADIYDEISSFPVVVYTYELSPFCSEALAVLRSTGTNFKEVSLGKEWIPGLIDSPEKRAALLEMTGQSSLPNVFIGGTSIGGLYSGSPGLIPALEKGELMDMIDEAKRSM